jgi:hypothetical protein
LVDEGKEALIIVVAAADESIFFSAICGESSTSKETKQSAANWEA